MKPLFTVHAGEYLVGSYIESKFPKWDVWIPSKDTGVDLLVTNVRSTKSVSLQVKFSKDFNPTHLPILLQSKLMSAGWWTHQEKKIKDSRVIFGYSFSLRSRNTRPVSSLSLPMSFCEGCARYTADQESAFTHTSGSQKLGDAGKRED